MGRRSDLLVRQVGRSVCSTISLGSACHHSKYVERFWRGATDQLVQNGYSQAPILFVQVPQLPKGALVEWQFAVHTGRRVTPVIHDDEELPVTHEYQTCEQCLGDAYASELTYLQTTKEDTQER